jgi:hypothetical protein
MRYLSCLIVLGFIFLAGCSSTVNQVEPYSDVSWLNLLIEKMQSDPVGNPPQSIWKYEYRNTTVFYVPPQCCDQYSVLYDINGNVLGAPDGGITGTGDGNVPDFFTARTNELLIWKDSRTQ